MPAEMILALGGQVGNSVMLSLLSRQSTGPETVGTALPPRTGAEPLACSPEAPQLEGPPSFEGMEMPAGGPMIL